jgi:type III pantothenate kinase
VSPNNEFVGGNIAPGAAMRFNALHHFTQKLPQLSLSADVPQQTLGFNTQTAIQLGVVNGIVYEIEGYIKELREKYPQLLIFLTGGDAFFFERRIKSSIFVSPNLLLLGLHRILMYNQCL